MLLMSLLFLLQLSRDCFATLIEGDGDDYSPQPQMNAAVLGLGNDAMESFYLMNEDVSRVQTFFYALTLRESPHLTVCKVPLLEYARILILGLNDLLPQTFQAVDINCVFPKTKVTPLAAAVYVNKHAMANMLIDLGASVSYADYVAFRVTSYRTCLNSGFFQRVLSLVPHQDRRVVYSECLIVALKYHKMDLIMDLLKAGADVLFYDGFVLKLAVRSNNAQAMQMLISDKVVPKDLLTSLLVLASEISNLEIVQELIKLGADSQSSLKISIQTHNMDLLLLLLANNVDFVADDSFFLKAIQFDFFDAVLFFLDPFKRHAKLLEKGFQVGYNPRRVQDAMVLGNAMSLAKDRANLELMNLLISYGGEIVFRQRLTPTEEATQLIRIIPQVQGPIVGHLSRLTHLLQNGAHLLTCLGSAVMVGHHETLFAFEQFYKGHEKIFEFIWIYAISHDMTDVAICLLVYCDPGFTMNNEIFSSLLKTLVLSPSPVRSPVLLAAALRRNYKLYHVLLQKGAILMPEVRAEVFRCSDEKLKLLTMFYDLERKTK